MKAERPSRRIGSHAEASSSLFFKSWKAAWQSRITSKTVKHENASGHWFKTMFHPFKQFGECFLSGYAAGESLSISRDSASRLGRG
ncbi:MAG: hypothetical protein QW190_00910 [Thermoproteota archaeon]